MSIAHLTSNQLRHAADLKEQIAGLEKQLASIEGGSGSGMPSPFKTKTVKPAKKGGMSAAGKAKIAAAQKLRWAKVKAAKAKPATQNSHKAVIAKPAKLGGKSVAAKVSQSDKMKAYWAAKKAAKTSPKPTAEVVAAAKPTAAPKPAKRKFVMSAAAKVKISAAAKARWAKVRAAKK
jgi:hypothetical protein